MVHLGFSFNWLSVSLCGNDEQPFLVFCYRKVALKLSASGVWQEGVCALSFLLLATCVCLFVVCWLVSFSAVGCTACLGRMI